MGSAAAITRSRGAYWTGRARLARGDAAGADAALSEAAAFPTTFYGQLAAARLRSPAPGPATLLDPSAAGPPIAVRLARMHDPHWSEADAIRFAGLELARAAELLVAWNDPRHARAFMLRLDQMATSDTDHALAASLSDRLGLPDIGVAIARAAGRHGLVLPQAGWPRPFAPPDDGRLPAGLVLAVMRQESSFDPQITSPAGARGLMQLTNGTAHDVARVVGRPELSGGGATLFDPAANMTLGTAYLDSLVLRFGGVIPYAVAAYNAGPHRVDRWLTQFGDPARAPDRSDDDRQSQMVDWIETIPFAETRNYVERVMENMAIYGTGSASRA
jgi:soluble lytic murein transglycosylase